MTPHSNCRVRDILEGKAEADSVLCRTSRFLILPDMKWDPSGPIASLYLLAIVSDPTIRSMRDLRGGHVGMLEEIRERAYGVVKERWGLPRGTLRMYIHYQPSYCTCLYSGVNGLIRVCCRSFPRPHRACGAGWDDGYGGGTGTFVGRYHFDGVSRERCVLVLELMGL